MIGQVNSTLQIYIFKFFKKKFFIQKNHRFKSTKKKKKINKKKWESPKYFFKFYKKKKKVKIQLLLYFTCLQVRIFTNLKRKIFNSKLSKIDVFVF